MSVRMTREQMCSIKYRKEVFNNLSGDLRVVVTPSSEFSVECLNELSAKEYATAWVAPEKVEIIPEYIEIDNVEAAASWARGEEVEYFSNTMAKWTTIHSEYTGVLRLCNYEWRKVKT